MNKYEKAFEEFMNLLGNHFDYHSDNHTSVDTGAASNCRDFWVTYRGVEFFVSARLSNREQSKIL